MTPHIPEAAFAFEAAIHANLAALAHGLDNAQHLAAAARDAMEAQNRNLAIGTVLPLESVLPDCVTLLRSVMALYGWRNRLPTQEGGAA